MASKKSKSGESGESKPSTPISTASGSITIGGRKYQVLGHANLPTFQVKIEEPVLVMFDAEMVTKQKMGKGQVPEVDSDGNPKTITIAKVVKVETGEVGQIVCGAILASRLKDYPGGYVGKSFVLIKHDAPSGKAKPWTITEVRV